MYLLLPVLFDTVEEAIAKSDMQNEGGPVSFKITINEDQKGDSGAEQKEVYIPRFIKELPNAIFEHNASMVKEIEIHGVTPRKISAKTKRRGRDQPYKAPAADYGQAVCKLKFTDVQNEMKKYPQFNDAFEAVWERKNDQGQIIGTFNDDLKKARSQWAIDRSKLDKGQEPDRYSKDYNVPNNTSGFSVTISIYIS